MPSILKDPNKSHSRLTQVIWIYKVCISNQPHMYALSQPSTIKVLRNGRELLMPSILKDPNKSHSRVTQVIWTYKLCISNQPHMFAFKAPTAQYIKSSFKFSSAILLLHNK